MHTCIIVWLGWIGLSWERTLDHCGALIEGKVKSHFAEVIKEANSYHPSIAEVYSRLEEFVLRRGKRLASTSTLLMYKGYTGKVDESILNLCAGIEIYRHSILAHDDLVDMDDFRRGGKTLHMGFKEKYGERFGEGVAVFVGNIACALAFRAVIDSGFPEEKVAKTLSTLSRGYQEVNESQILDLLFEHKDVGVAEWRVMASKRAASLFNATMLSGAILGGAPNSDLRLIEDAAENLGYAFDIQDDIIDTFANEDQYGRPLCRDIGLGKKPLHIVYTLSSENREAATALKECLGQKSPQVDLIRIAIKESGGLDRAKEESKKHAEKARILISQTGLDSEVKEFFYDLTSFIEESLDWYK